MKSDLYKIIYRIALMCMIFSVILMLTDGLIIRYQSNLRNIQSGITLIYATLFGLGAIIFVVSLVVFLMFKSKYKIESEIEIETESER